MAFLTDLFSAATQQAPVGVTGGGLWDTIKSAAGSVVQWGAELGAKVIERKVLPLPAPIPPAPKPALAPAIIATQPTQAPPVYDWGMGGQTGGIVAPAPLPAVAGISGATLLVIMGVALLAMKGGK